MSEYGQVIKVEGDGDGSEGIVGVMSKVAKQKAHLVE